MQNKSEEDIANFYLNRGDVFFKNCLSAKKPKEQAEFALEQYNKALENALKINYKRGTVEANIGIDNCSLVLNKAIGLYIVPDFYEPYKKNKKKLIPEDPISFLNKKYRQAIVKIITTSPSSFKDTLTWSLCMDGILQDENLLKKNGFYSIKMLEDQINRNKELEILNNALDSELNDSNIATLLKKCQDTLNKNDPDIDKLRSYREVNNANIRRLRSDMEKLGLVKLVTKAHEQNLVLSKNFTSKVTSSINLVNILDDYLKREQFVEGGEVNECCTFTFFQESYSDKKKAILALKDALQGEEVDLLSHLSTLCKGELGSTVRAFVKKGLADNLLNDENVRTVSEFIRKLHVRVNPHSPRTCF